MKKLIILIILLLATPVFAISYDSNGTGGGDWGVAASWNPLGIPGAGDDVDILAGDTIEIDGDISVGGSPGNNTTWNIAIHGDLEWPTNPGADWTFSAFSSMRVYNGGTFKIGTKVGPLNCSNTALVQFQTAAQKYYIHIEDGAEFIVNGCVGYPATSGSVIRSRISACSNITCNAGAITITLDDTHNWSAARTDSIGVGNHRLIIGSGGGLTNPLGDLSEITTVVAYPAANTASIVLANNHQVGDIVINATRNIGFTSTTAANHSKIYSAGGEYFVKWTSLDEMGDSTTTNGALVFDDAVKTLGSWDYISATNCDDTAAVTCFYGNSSTWTSMQYNVAYSVNAGRGFDLLGTSTTTKSTTGLMAISGTGASTGIKLKDTDDPFLLDECWLSGFPIGINGSMIQLTDSLFHEISSVTATFTAPVSFYRRVPVIIQDNEIRNVAGGFDVAIYNGRVIENDFDNSADFCLQLSETETVDFFLDGNTYDNCSVGLLVSARSGNIYSVNEDYGSTNANVDGTIVFEGFALLNAFQNSMRATFNEGTFVAESVPPWTDGPIWIDNTANWFERAALGPETFLTVHNKNSVEGDHWGIGPGGLIIERDTTFFIDNTLNLKVTPYAADRYHRVPLGSVYVDSGDVLTIKVKVRKNQAMAAARLPRLVLKGSGFDPETDTDTMQDINNTWDQLQVSGTATAGGKVSLYLEVIGELAAGASPPTIEPKDPPTLIIYADELSFTRQ
jgi:hypothetical protein